MAGVLYTRLASAAILHKRILLKNLTETLGSTNVNDTISPFQNLKSGGQALLAALPEDISKDVVVLGIVSAGVPAAVEVAHHLRAPLDVILLRRLLAPGGPGTQAGAAYVAGTLVVDKEIGPRPEIPQTPFDHFAEDALSRLALRNQVCRGELPPRKVTGKQVLLVDCAMRTGLTMRAAITALRVLNVARITAAVPVTSREGVRIAEELADEFIYLAAPEPFGNAGVWYKDFRRQNDEDISELLIQ